MYVAFISRNCIFTSYLYLQIQICLTFNKLMPVWPGSILVTPTPSCWHLSDTAAWVNIICNVDHGFVSFESPSVFYMAHRTYFSSFFSAYHKLWAFSSLGAAQDFGLEVSYNVDPLDIVPLSSLYDSPCYLEILLWVMRQWLMLDAGRCIFSEHRWVGPWICSAGQFIELSSASYIRETFSHPEGLQGIGKMWSLALSAVVFIPSQGFLSLQEQNPEFATWNTR